MDPSEVVGRLSKGIGTVEFRGETIKGRLSLVDLQFDGPIKFIDCTIHGDFDISRAHIFSLELRNCEVKGHLILQQSRLKGHATLAEIRATSLQGTELRVGGRLDLQGAVIKEGIVLLDAVIEGSIRAQTLESNATLLDGSKIGHGVFFTKATIANLRMLHANVGTVVDLEEAKIEALNLDGLSVGGSLNGKKSRIGTAHIIAAHVKGDINFREVHFSGRADFDRTTVEDSIRFMDARFDAEAEFLGLKVAGQFIFDNAIVAKNFSAQGLIVEGDARFIRARFTGEADFDRAQFGSGLFADNNGAAIFQSTATFMDVCFNGNANFYQCEFYGRSRFDRMQVRGRMLFGKAKFRTGNEPVGLLGLRIGGQAVFDEAEFSSALHLDGSVIEQDLRFFSAVFHSGVAFPAVRVGGQAVFDGAVFKDTVSFVRMNVAGELGLLGTRFEKAAYFERADIQGGVFVGQHVSGTVTTFQGPASFTGCHFGAMLNLSKVDLQGVTDFSNAVFDAIWDYTAFARLIVDHDVEPGNSLRTVEDLAARAGNPAAARSIYYLRRSTELSARWSEAQKSRAIRPLPSLAWNAILRYTVGYGVRPERLMAILVALTVAQSIALVHGASVANAVPSWPRAVTISIASLSPLPSEDGIVYESEPVEVLVNLIRVTGWITVTIGVLALGGFFRKFSW